MLKTYFDEVIKKWFKGKSERPFIEYIVDELEKDWDNSNVFIIEAPTGYGKSTISATLALYSINEELKSIVVFPLRALLEDQYNKFANLVKGYLLGKRYMHNPDSRYLIKPITLTTVDTLSMTLFGIPPEDIEKVIRAWDGTLTGSLGHYLFSWASVALSNIVLDEVHLLADSTKSLSFLIALMRICIDFNQKLILMTATLPKSLKETIRENVPSVKFIEFKPNMDPKFCKERESKKYNIILEEVPENCNKYELILRWIKENERFSKIIVVFNTVKDAINFYSIIKNKNAILLHSRFSEKDREEKLKKLQEIRDRDRYIIVSTQVIEAGVDISSNLFITEIAPANSLIQRLGRFLRYNEKDGNAIIWYEGKKGKVKAEKEKYKVYDQKLTQKTLDWLMENSEVKNGKRVVNLNVHLPESKAKKGFKSLLDYVYSKDEFKVDKKVVDEFETIFLHLEDASLKAVNVFFKMEGSFVRDNLLVPVVSAKAADCLQKLKLHNFIKMYVVPISFETFKGKIKNIIGIVTEQDNEIVCKKGDLEYLSRDVKPKKILKRIVRDRIVAFIINAEYDDELGLRF